MTVFLQTINIPLTILIIVTILTVYFSLIYSIVLILSFINNDDMINIKNEIMLIITVAYHYIISIYLCALLDFHIGQFLNILIFGFLLYYTLWRYYFNNDLEILEELNYIWDYDYERSYIHTLYTLSLIWIELTIIDYLINLDLIFFLLPLLIIFNINTYLILKRTIVEHLFSINPISIPTDIDINLIIILIYQCSISFLFLLYNLKGDISEINIFLNGYEYILTSLIVLIRPYSNFSTTGIINKKFISKSIVKNVKDTKSKVKRITRAISPSSTKDYLLLGISSIKSSYLYFFKAFSKINKWIIKNPFFAPFYIIFKKIILPLSIVYYILKKLRWLRFFVYVSSLVLGYNLEFFDINFERFLGIIIFTYEYIISNFLNIKSLTFGLFSRVFIYLYEKFSSSKETIEKTIEKVKTSDTKSSHNGVEREKIKGDNLREDRPIRRWNETQPQNSNSNSTTWTRRFDKPNSYPVEYNNPEKSLRDTYKNNLPQYEDDRLTFLQILTIVTLFLALGFTVWYHWDDIHGWVIAIPGILSSGRDLIVGSYTKIMEILGIFRDNRGDGGGAGGNNRRHEDPIYRSIQRVMRGGRDIPSTSDINLQDNRSNSEAINVTPKYNNENADLNTSTSSLISDSSVASDKTVIPENNNDKGKNVQFSSEPEQISASSQSTPIINNSEIENENDSGSEDNNSSNSENIQLDFNFNDSNTWNGIIPAPFDTEELVKLKHILNDNNIEFPTYIFYEVNELEQGLNLDKLKKIIPISFKNMLIEIYNDKNDDILTLYLENWYKYLSYLKDMRKLDQKIYLTELIRFNGIMYYLDKNFLKDEKNNELLEKIHDFIDKYPQLRDNNFEITKLFYF